MCSTGAAHGCTRPGTEWVYDRRQIVDGKVRKEQKMKGRGKKIEVVVENFGISFLSLSSPSCDRDYTDESGSERGWIVWVWCGVVWVRGSGYGGYGYTHPPNRID